MPSSNTSNSARSAGSGRSADPANPEQGGDLREPAREIERLSELLRRYQHEYFVLSRPSVSDQEYDRLFDALLRLEETYPQLRRPDSPTLRVGSDLSRELPEVSHTVPVLSLDKAYGVEDLEAWLAKTARNAGRDLAFVVEEKIDGASIVLYYEQGQLDRAVTRGNGLVGNDVTANVRTIGAVPLRLPRPDTLAVRGEIFLPLRLFERINSTLETPYANPRNLASGTLRRVKSAEVAAVPLDITVYEGYLPSARSKLHSHAEILGELEELGFKINTRTGFFGPGHEQISRRHPSWRAGPLSALPAYLDEARRSRRERDYEIDGLVVKVDDLRVREELGFTGHHPRWAMAFKFEAPEAESTVQRIEVQVGRTGRITPVARIFPVRLSGSTISNATLHNQDYVELLELAVGDRVSISKRGDVIPAVERVIEKNEAGARTWKMPERCPTCESALQRVGAHHFCTNLECPDQVRGRLMFFAARGQMDIENLGPETLALLIDTGMVREIDDIYRFDPGALAGKPGFGDKKIALIREGIEKSRRQPFRTVLVALGIPELGQKVVELLVEAGFRDIDRLLAAVDAGDPEVFTTIHGIGEKTAQTLIRELSRPEVRRRIESLRAAGLAMAEGPPAGAAAGPALPQSFAGQTWCVTGSFERFQPRELAMEELRRRGGRVTSTVSSKTTHLLAGSGAGSKLDAARRLGVQVVSEQEFLALLS